MEMRSVLAGITIGLLIGAAVSLLISTPMLTQINDLHNQVSNLESQIMDKNAQIGNLSARVSNLESRITDLEAQIPPERKGEYNLVATFRGQSGGSTDFFYLDEPDIMVTWNWTSSRPRDARFNIFLWKQNASAYSASWTFLPSNGSTFIHNVETGFYYLSMPAINLNSWAVSVYKWVPE